jgi:hypothetical protein
MASLRLGKRNHLEAYRHKIFLLNNRLVNTNVKVKLFEICYRPEQIGNVQSPMIPWDNTINLSPELREYPVFKNGFEYARKNGLEMWGLVSNKFANKTGISGDRFVEWITDQTYQRSANLYFINPCPIIECLFPSVIAHGEYWHPGITNLVQRTLNEMGIKLDLANVLMDSDIFAMCNYFCGDRFFWERYLEFINQFLQAIDRNEADKELMFQASAGYNPDKSLAYYPFVIERLFSVFLYVYHDRIKSHAYQHTLDELITKTGLTKELCQEIQALSAMKKSAIGKNSKLLKHWEFLRSNFLARHPEVFGLE